MRAPGKAPGHWSRPKGVSGFSLIEVLVATAIFSIIAVVAWSGIAALVSARETVSRQGDRLRALQLAVGGLERDLSQSIARPVRGPGGITLPALVGDATGLEVSLIGFATQLDPHGGRVRRHAWRQSEGQLLRNRFPTLDRADFGPRDDPEVMLDAISVFRIRYLGESGEWTAFWPPRLGPDARPGALPRAIEITVEAEGLGSVRRVIAPPAGAAP
jgi:general secretion pathway protein J